MIRKLAITATALVLAACGETPVTQPSNDAEAEAAQLKADALDAFQRHAEELRTDGGPQRSHPAPVTYEGVLVNGHGQGGSVRIGSIFESGDWDYWSFCAVAGATIDIEVHRTTSAMDPAASIWTGITPNAGGLFAFSTGNAFLSFVASADDNNGIPHGTGGAWADPKIVTAAPATGLYTLTVFDWLGAGPPDANGEAPYDILASGLGAPPIAVSTSADTETLWPPNHKMKTVVVTVASSGGCGSLTVSVSVSSDEPENGTGDGDTAPDWSVTDNGDGTFDVELRAERAGGGDGRKYTITATATDATGASASSSVEVNVPHDKGKK